MTLDPPETLDLNSLITLVRKALSKPLKEEIGSDGSMIFIGDDPNEVVVQIVGDEITISVFAVKWEGPHNPVMRPQRVASLDWQRLPAERLKGLLQELVETARQLRRARFRTCIRCGETTPPECMHDQGTCQTCAERHLGVVY